MTKKKFLVVSFILLSGALSAQKIIAPTVKSKTTFAIVIDETSLDKVRDMVYAYRDVIEKDRLGTYIISGNWKSPDAIREILIELHHDKKAPLEGVVLVGDIPIPMIRDAQHLTSAFKMNQSRNWQESSIASDRFYDDFGLKFDFIKQDSIKTLMYYYSLQADSKQFICQDIYSARIKPLERADKYAQLEAYLKKVVAERSAAPNIIDNLTMARGHGYNSESKVAWSGEQITLKEQFPELFNAGNWVRFMDFETLWPMKPVWLVEVQRPELDIMLFHHHGSNDVQYINGYKNASDPQTSVENIKLYLRSKVRAAVGRGKSKEEAVESYQKYLDVPRSWCEEAFDPQKEEADSLYNLNLDIYVSDVLKIKPNARFVMFDACYNGSFYEDEYIAGAYIFNDGKTIITQGNTVNTIQDKWPDEFLGLLNAGLRIGLWGKQAPFLETHLIGDPTYRFANHSTVRFDINEAIALHGNDKSYWLKLTGHTHADVRAMALRVLYTVRYNKLSDLLRDTYFASQSAIVRLEAVRLSALINDANTIRILDAAVSDSYELIRRFAIEYIAKNGSDKLIPAFVRSLFTDYTSERIRFKQQQGFNFLPADWLKQEINVQAAERPYFPSEKVNDMLKGVNNAAKSMSEEMGTIMDTLSPLKKKQSSISRYRNFPVIFAIDSLLSFAADSSRDTSLRVQSVEALGWYVYSCRKKDVINGLQKIIATTDNEQLRYEAKKSVGRLSD
ncbi:MAG: HEAT repeat domain-containing protein [Dysgonamonadaceae bacterium]|jgi:hypothetical protein|nr:HEAT repeat domain-containing protein [Dysgonamonadaceae bacterium]